MPTPTSRSKILPARGSKANLDAALAAGNLLEGELCYAKDEDALYQVEAGVLVKAGGGLQPGDNVSLLANDAGYITSAEAPVDSVNGKVGAVSLGLPGLNDVKPFPVTQTTWTMINGDDVTGSMPSATGYVLEPAVAVHPTSLQGDRQAEMRAWIATLSTPFTLEMLVNGNSISATVDAISDSSSLSGAFYPRFLFVFEPDLAEAPAVGGTISFPAFDAYYTNNYVTPYVTDGQVLTWVNAKNQWEPADAVAAPVDSVNGETGVVSLGIQDMDDYDLNSGAATHNFTGQNNQVTGTGVPDQDSEWRAVNPGSGDSYFQFYRDGGAAFVADFDALQVGNSVTWTFDSTTEFTSTVTAATGGGNFFTIADAFPSAIDTATLCQVTSVVFSGVPIALVDGDILQWNNGAQKFKPAQLATVATSGSYNDLDNKPTIPENTSDLVNDSGYITDPGVSQIVAGNNVSISPVGGTGVVTIEATLPVGGGTIDGGNFDTGVDTADGTAILDGGIFD